jgi:multicomponent Na+:H+ antiporter subunit E
VKSLLTRQNIFKLILLWLFWLILARRLDIQTLTIGFAMSFLVLLYTKDLSFKGKETLPFRWKTLFLWLKLLGHFARDLVLSNISVAKLLLSRKMNIKPTFVRKPQKLNQVIHQTLYSNAITLTPGTLTVLSTPDFLYIHALTQEAYNEILDHQIEKDFLALEGQKNV